jgi:hypothetical protein
MKIKLLSLILIMYPCALLQAEGLVIEKRVKIAVIDTGLDVTSAIKPFLCKTGHISLIDDAPLKDTYSGKHGTNVAGLIAKNLDAKKECLLIIKFYKESKDDFFKKVRLGINYAVTQKVKFINLSLGGSGSSDLEKLAIFDALRKGIRVSVAAGNDKKDLNENCYYYPACYAFGTPLFRVVGSNTGKYSNKGRVVTNLEDGTGVGTPKLSGTSQATAINTGKWVREIYK